MNFNQSSQHKLDILGFMAVLKVHLSSNMSSLHTTYWNSRRFCWLRQGINLYRGCVISVQYFMFHDETHFSSTAGWKRMCNGHWTSYWSLTQSHPHTTTADCSEKEKKIDTVMVQFSTLLPTSTPLIKCPSV